MSTRNPADEFAKVELLGIPIWRITEPECVTYIADRAGEGVGGVLVTPNLDILRQCRDDPSVHALVRNADCVVADGMPLIWACQLQGTPLPERVAGSNLISSLCAEAAHRGLKLFFLGGAEDTQLRAADLLRERHPGIRIVGAYGPPFGFEKDAEEMARIERMIEDAAPDIVFVGLPFPKANRLTERIRHKAPAAWWCGIGVSFSFLTGDVTRAPGWMQDAGLEWLHRLGQEPERLVKRYLVHGIPFALELLARAPVERIKRKVD